MTVRHSFFSLSLSLLFSINSFASVITMTETQKIIAPDQATGDLFGFRFDVDEDHLYVRASGKSKSYGYTRSELNVWEFEQSNTNGLSGNYVHIDANLDLIMHSGSCGSNSSSPYYRAENLFDPLSSGSPSIPSMSGEGCNSVYSNGYFFMPDNRGYATYNYPPIYTIVNLKMVYGVVERQCLVRPRIRLSKLSYYSCW